MKKTSWMLLLLAGSFCLPVAAEKKQDACRIPALKSAYAELKANPQSKEKQLAFLTAFPDSWQDFIAVYQHYDPQTKSYDRLYQQSVQYIALLENLNQVDDARMIPHLGGSDLRQLLGGRCPQLLVESIVT